MGLLTSMPLTSEEVIAQFQARRSQTSRMVGPWILSAAVGFLTVAIALGRPSAFSEVWRLNLVFGGFLAGAVSIIGINITVSRHYRCPECGKVPIGRNGIILDPDACPTCGAVLRG